MRHQATMIVEVPQHQHVRVDIHDALGRRVQVLWDGELGPGPHRLYWDASAAPGLYAVRLQTPRTTDTRAVTVLPSSN